MDGKPQRFFFVLSVLLLGLFIWAFANQARLARLPQDLDASEFDYPVRIEDRVLGSPQELEFFIGSRPLGRPLVVETETGASLRVTPVRAHGPGFLVITWVTALLFWVVSTLVFAPRTERRTVRYFYAASMLYGLAIAVGLVHYPQEPVWPTLLLPSIRILCLALVPTFFVLVSLTFPAEHEAIRKHPYLLLGLLAIAISVGSWHAGTMAAYVLGFGGTDWNAVTISAFVADLQLVLFFLAGVFLFYRSGRRAVLEREKKQVKWVLWGVSIGATPYILLWTMPRVFGLAPIIPLELARFAAGATPIAFSLAVARYQFLDIDLIIRRSLVYTGLAFGLLLAYLLAGGLVGQWSESLEPKSARLVTFLAAALAVGLFLPSRKPLQKWVDRTFFRIRYDYALATETLKQDLQGASSQSGVAVVLHDTLIRHLLPRRVAVIALSPVGPTVAGSVPSTLVEDSLPLLLTSNGPSSVLVAQPEATSVMEVESESFPLVWRNAGFSVVQPICVNPGSPEARLLGAIFVGPKRSERRFIEQDLRLLADMAIEASTVLDRLRLVQDVAQEALARDRLRELDRLKSDFLSRVAHDLRTPLTSIRWTAQNLQDGIGGPVTERQRDDLRALLVATDHLVSLVNNLLEISRLELGAEQVLLRPVRLLPILESVLVALRPIASSRNVRLELVSEGAETVVGHEEKLQQVFFNLVENAIKYSPDGAAVEIRLHHREDGTETLTVRDHGPGLGEVETAALFERFQQGATAPYSGSHGFGIGLYVVRSLLEAMQATVRAGNHPEGGAVFICEFASLRALEDTTT